MSALVRLSSKLPGVEETNGLDRLAPELADMDHVVCAIVWLQPTKVTISLATGDEVPTVEVARIEPIGTLDQVPPEVVQLAAKLYEKRTGKAALPFDELEEATRGPVEIDDDDEPDAEVLDFMPPRSDVGDVFVYGGDDDE